MTKHDKMAGKSADAPTLREAVRSVVARNKLLTFGMFLVILMDVAAALIPPLVLEGIVDRLTGGRAVGIALALSYFLLLAVSGVLDSAQAVLITVYGQKITHGIRSELGRKLVRLPADYFTGHPWGRTVSLFVNDVDTIEKLFDEGIISMFADACKVLAIIAVIFTRSLGLGVLLVVVTPFLFFMTRLFQKRMLAAQLGNRRAIAKVNNHVPETIGNIRMIHALSKERYMEKRYDRYIQDSYRSMEKANFYDSIYSPIVITVSAAVIAVMMTGSALGGGMQAFFGMSVGSAVAVIAYVGKVFTPLESIGMEIENIQSAMAGIRRIRDFLGEEERAMPGKREDGHTAEALRRWESTGRQPSGGTAGARCGVSGAETKGALSEAQSSTSGAELKGAFSGAQSSATGAERAEAPADVPSAVPAVDLSHITFSYRPGEPVLQDFSLRVGAGENITLAGRTGAGKSTVFRILLGLYAPQGGEVRIFGQPAAALPDAARRRIFGYVEQSVQLIDGSIADQISLADPSISREQVEAAAALVGLDPLIRTFPDDYDTPCRETLFSQGQLQLLSIARAVAANPRILLLDEITAHMDSDTERLIMDALKKASASRTVLSISHRLYEQTAESRLVQIG